MEIIKLMMAQFHLAAPAGSLSHCHGALGYLNIMEPLLMLLVTQAGTLTRQNVRCEKKTSGEN